MDSATTTKTKPHVVCVPSPAQGHINAMLQLAKLLHSKSIYITFVHTEANYNRVLATSGSSSLVGLNDFRFEAIDDGYELSEPANGEQLSTLCSTVRNKLSHPFRKLLMRLDELSSGPKVTCVVSDTYSSYTLDVAAEFGIPDVSFCSVSACGFWGFFLFKELVERGIVPLKSEDDLINGYLDTRMDWIPGKSMRLREFPSFALTTNPNDTILNFCKDESQDAKKASAMIINTFEGLESPVLDAISDVLPPIYSVGPLNLMCRKIHNEALKNIGSNLWKEDPSCLKWLQGRAHNSVIYVNFGSLTVMSRQQFLEFAWGLANSGHDFLWVIRPGTVNGDSGNLPVEFLSDIRERGYIADWCPQEEVLMHPSIGGFLTHCGWNSTTDSISNGVPMICWPHSGDQQTNCWYLCHEWGNGLEVSNDVKREDVARVIIQVLTGEKGAEMRKNALKWKDKAIEATRPGGNSFTNLQRVIEEIILGKKEYM